MCFLLAVLPPDTTELFLLWGEKTLNSVYLSYYFLKIIQQLVPSTVGPYCVWLINFNIQQQGTGDLQNMVVNSSGVKWLVVDEWLVSIMLELEHSTCIKLCCTYK